MRKYVIAAAALCLMVVNPALGQEEKVAVEKRGSDAITLDVTNDTAGIGYWHKISDKTDVGLDFSFRYDGDKDSDYQAYELVPAIKYYLTPEKAYSPYLYGGIGGTYAKNDRDTTASNTDTSSETYSVGAKVGVGLDWFPVRHVSLGGHVGVRAQYNYYRSSYRTLNTTGYRNSLYSTTSIKDEGFSVGTFNSGIRLNLFF